MSKTVIAKYAVGGKNFEIFVDSDQAYEYISGKRSDPLAALEVDEIFSDANKGERQSAEAVKKAFGTEDRAKIVETILKKGNVPVTTEQRNKMLEEKRKQIITIIATNSIDPRTGAPHPAQRIENAMKEVRVQIDPFKNATEQVDSVVKQLSVRLPIKFATARMDVIIPAEYANRCYGLLKQYGLKSEKWLDNGSLNAEVEFPAGLQGEFFEKLNSFTKGNAIAKKIGS
jgi:ribosome maturation protein SDO1